MAIASGRKNVLSTGGRNGGKKLCHSEQSEESPRAQRREVPRCARDDTGYRTAACCVELSPGDVRPICAPSTANTGSFCCIPFIDTSPRDSVWKLPIVRSKVFFEITVCPGLATPLSRREAMFTALPSTV